MVSGPCCWRGRCGHSLPPTWPGPGRAWRPRPATRATGPRCCACSPARARGLFGVLYQEVGGQPETTVTFQMKGQRTATGLQLSHVRKLNETRSNLFSYWCDGAITFTYDASQEKLTGHATYRPLHDCDTGTFTLYRVRLKSAATVPAGTASTLRVSGRDVQWFADAERKQPLATGNTYRAKLAKTTTFYLTQGFYPTVESPVTPITIQVAGAAKAAPVPRPLPPPPAPAPAPAPPDSLPPAAAVPPAAPAPLVLPKVLFRQGTAELLPEAGPGAAPAGGRAAGHAQPAPAHSGPYRPPRRARQKPGALRAARRRRKGLFGAGRRGRRPPRNHRLRRQPPALSLARRSQPARGSGKAALSGYLTRRAAGLLLAGRPLVVQRAQGLRHADSRRKASTPAQAPIRVGPKPGSGERPYFCGSYSWPTLALPS